jgi:hypothetical protein
MQFKLTYNNGVNSFNYEFSGANIPEENIINALQAAVETLFPQALFVIPDVIESEPELSEEDQAREALYDEVDKIIEDMYGYHDE